MHSNVSMSLLKPTILLDKMQIISSDDNCSLHLSRYDDSSINIIIIKNIERDKVLRSDLELYLLENSSSN